MQQHVGEDPAVNPEYIEAIHQATGILTSTFTHHLDLVENAEQIDQIVYEVVREIGRKTTEQLMTGVGEELARTVKTDEPEMTIDHRKPISMTTRFGKIFVPSPYLRDRVNGLSTRPLRDVLGWRSGTRTCAVQRALTDFGLEKSFQRASSQFEEHYGFGIHRDAIRRDTLHHAKQVAAYLEKRLAEERKAYRLPLQERAGVEEMLVELDGCMIRTGHFKPAGKPGQTAVRKLPKKIREEAWREVRVGLARSLDEDDKSYVAAIASYPTICTDLFSIAVSRGLSKRTAVVSVGDGGHGLREELSRHFESFTYLLDMSHLKQNLYQTAESLRMDEGDRRHWVTELMEWVWTGQFDRLYDRLEKIIVEGSKRTEQLLGFLKRYQDSLDYAGANNNDWPLGSGEIESAHRYIPQERLKLPGTWWALENVNPILAARIIRANGWWEDFWKWQKKNNDVA